MWYLNNRTWMPWACMTQAFSEDECDNIIAMSNKLELQDAEVKNTNELKPDVRSNSVGWVTPNNDTLWFYNKLSEIIHTMNNKFWNFDLESIPELQFTKYANIGDGYNSHVDIVPGSSPSYRKLSFSLQLTDGNDYEGCDLEFVENNDIAPRERGAIIFFPSFVMHRVTPLISGERNAMVGWVCGPDFK